MEPTPTMLIYPISWPITSTPCRRSIASPITWDATRYLIVGDQITRGTPYWCTRAAGGGLRSSRTWAASLGTSGDHDGVLAGEGRVVLQAGAIEVLDHLDDPAVFAARIRNWTAGR